MNFGKLVKNSKVESDDSMTLEEIREQKIREQASGFGKHPYGFNRRQYRDRVNDHKHVATIYNTDRQASRAGDGRANHVRVVMQRNASGRNHR